MKNLSVNFPDDIIDKFNIEGVIISPYINTIGWVFLSEDAINNIVLRIYLIETESESLAFELSDELAVFMFPTQIEMKEFYNHLLSMSALEYMIILKETANHLN